MKENINDPSSPQSRSQFLQWYQTTAVGQSLQTIEASYLLDWTKLTYNQKILQVGRLGSEARYLNEEFHKNFCLVDIEASRTSRSFAQIRSEFGSLPIATESIDVLVLPHVLEFEDNPHPLLREVDRILKPEGQAIVLGFNPWSLHVLQRRLLFRKDFSPRSRIGCNRLMDWFSLLKFETEFCAGFGLSSSQTVFRPDTFLTRSLAHMATSYAVKAIKRTYTLIPIKPSWTRASSLLPGRIVDTPLMRK